MENITLTVPQGTRIFNHSDPSLVCRSTRWTDIGAFFLGNYVAHAATVKSRPGELLVTSLFAQCLALIFPTVGVGRGIEAMTAWTAWYNFRKRLLYAAARAGALCMVIRDYDWEPEPSLAHDVSYALLSYDDTSGLNSFTIATGNAPNCEHQGNLELQPMTSKRVMVYDPAWAVTATLQNFDVSRWRAAPKYMELTRNIHGFVRLPNGYTLTLVPPDAEVDFFGPPGHPVPDHSAISPAYIPPRNGDDVENGHAIAPPDEENGLDRPVYLSWDIAYSWSFIKALISLLQLLWSIASLYRARGNQIDIYGYAAFGLTVAPYTVMAFVNLVSNLVAVDYPKLYLVESPIMREAIDRGGLFSGTVGALRPADLDPSCGNYLSCHLQRGREGCVECVIDERHRGNRTLDNVKRLEPRPGYFAIPNCLPFQRSRMPQINQRFDSISVLPSDAVHWHICGADVGKSGATEACRLARTVPAPEWNVSKGPPVRQSLEGNSSIIIPVQNVLIISSRLQYLENRTEAQQHNIQSSPTQLPQHDVRHLGPARAVRPIDVQSPLSRTARTDDTAGASPAVSASSRITRDQPLAHEVGLLSLTNASDPNPKGCPLAYVRRNEREHVGHDPAPYEVPEFELPSMADCRQYAEMYFTASTFYPFISQDVFYAVLREVFRLSKTSTWESRLSIKLALARVFLVLSLGARFLEIKLNANFCSRELFTTGMGYGAQIKLHDSIEGVFLDLGLQRRDNNNKDTESTYQRNTRHLRSAIFWSAYSMDRTLTTILGRPLTLRDETCDREFPGFNDGDEVEEAATSWDRSANHQAAGPERAPTSYTACIYSLRFDRLVAEIKLMLYRVSRSPSRFPWPTDVNAWQLEAQGRRSVMLLEF
ncbi:hypothetical protein BBP40_009543 [Aspergillus hancockii]|nr:hypothetical protein BBP40_009543 [Aspergillus hancockii]